MEPIKPEVCPLCDTPARCDGRNGRRTTWSCTSCGLTFEPMARTGFADSGLHPRKISLF